MKQVLIICTVLALLAVPVTAQVSGWAELETEFRPKEAPGVHLKFGLDKALGEKMSVSTFTLVDHGYGEATVSLGRKVGAFQFSLGGGLETVAPYWRVVASASGEKAQFFGDLTTEYGASGFWYTSNAGYHMTKNWSAGFHSQRYEGSGAFVERRTGKHASVGLSVLGTRQGVVVIPSLTTHF